MVSFAQPMFLVLMVFGKILSVHLEFIKKTDQDCSLASAFEVALKNIVYGISWCILARYWCVRQEKWFRR